MNPLLPEPDRSGYIECYGAEFPADDPQSLASYTRVLMPAFDHQIPASSPPFTASMELFFLPEVTVSWAKVTASRYTRTIRTIAARGTDQILMVCYRSGHFDLTTGGRTRRVEAGEMAFIDLSQETIIEAPSVDNISLAASRRRLEGTVPFIDGAHGFIRPVDAVSKLLRGMLEAIVDVGPAMPVVDARGIARATLQLVAACLEPLSRKPIESGRNIVSLVVIRVFVEQHLLEPALGPQSLIDEFGITRSTLYRLFEPLGGVSAYIARRKLNHAFRLLSDTQQPSGRISSLAAELRFSHPSAFTRAFKATFGLSPRDVQALALQSREREVELLTSPEPLNYLKPIVRPHL